MLIKISEQAKKLQTDVRLFVEREIIPQVQSIENDGRISEEIVSKLAGNHLLGMMIPEEYGGQNIDPLSLALLHEELGQGHTSVENMLTVVGMVVKAITSAGDEEQKKRWLPGIAAGSVIPAFAMSESNIGSDIKGMETVAVKGDGHFMLKGNKKWITLGQIADLFIVFAKCDNRGAAFLVERDTPGLSVVPMSPTFGLRGNMLAELHFDDCQIPEANLLGRIGSGFNRVAAFALDEGRYTTACGCVGLGKACLNASLKYVNQRKQFDVYLKEHQLVQKMITEMIVNIQTAKLLCYQAGTLREMKDPTSISYTLMAKYHASKMANLAADYAIQIHGAVGCSTEYAVERYYRDAKIMEIIEGSTQLYEMQIAKNPVI